MGTVLKFTLKRTTVRPPKGQRREGDVIIFPGVRYEHSKKANPIKARPHRRRGEGS